MTNLGDGWIRIRPDTRGFAGEANRGVSGAMKSIAKASAIAFAAGAAGATVALTGMAKAAIADQQAQALLARQLKASAGATDAQVAATERWITAQGKALGVTDDELRPALAKLVSATGDVGKAQKLASLAMDVSAGTGKDLGAVSTALMKAQNGQVSSLSRLGINTKNAAGETIGMKEAVKRMSDQFGGAAKTKAQTLQGQMTRLKVIFSEAGETIGAKLIPFLTKLAGWVANKVVPAIGRLGGFLKTNVVPVIKDFAAQIRDRVVPAAVRFGGFIRSTVIPAVKEFATFIRDKVVPAAVRFGGVVATKLKPVLDRLVDVIKNQIIPTWVSWLPTIKSIAEKVGLFAAGAIVLASAIAGKVLPPIITLVGWLVTFKPVVIGVVAAFVAWKTVSLIMSAVALAQAAIVGFWTAAITVNIAVSKAAAAASKVWAAGQWLLNAALTANPIGLVVVAIAALVAGVIIAYKTSDTFRAIVQGAWDKIKQAVSVAWNSVIKPALAAFVGFITGQLIPFIKFLWNNVVKPVFSAIGHAIRFTWNNIIQPVFKAWKAYLTSVVFPVIRFLWNNVVKPVFTSLGNKIRDTWNNVIRPTFNFLKDGIGKVKDAFKTAINRIKELWGELKQKAHDAVWFVVNTVYNHGIVPVVNAIPGIPGKLTAVTMASGGVLPGYTPGRDVHEFVSRTGGRLHLSGGEAIMRPEWVRAMGGPLAIDRMNKYARQGTLRNHGDVGAFAEGGLFAPALAWAQSQEGKPYVWGGVGPGGYDCSGFMSAITNYIRGKDPHSRIGGTADFPWPGFVPKVGEFTIGSTPDYGGSGTGHMAGTLIGTAVESRGGSGVLIGPGARAHTDPGFSTVAHIGHGGGTIWGEVIEKFKDLWTKMHAAVAKLSTMGDWGNMMKDAVKSIAAGIRDWINGKIPGPGPVPAFDRGGVGRGRGSLLKNTMRPERVLSPRQTVAFERLVDMLERNGGAGGPLVNIDTVNTYDVHAAARAISAEQRKALMIASLA